MTIEELKALALKVAEATKDMRVISFGCSGCKDVHMSKEGLFELFGEVEKKESCNKDYPYRFSVMVDDIEFFALSED